MPPSCNKCKKGIAQEADTWCLGCSSLELSQGLLRQNWRHAGLRAISEEALLSSARLVRAFANLDGTLVGGPSAGSPVRAPGLTTAAKPKAERPQRSRSPKRDDRPPLVRSPKRTSRSSAPAVPHRESESDFDEDEEEEEEEDEPIEEVKREHYGSRRPPEPEGPPPSRREEDRRSERSPEHRREDRQRGEEKKKRPRGKGRRRRGGARHQRRHRDQKDPFRRSHRKLRSDQLELATSLEEGLERRF